MATFTEHEDFHGKSIAFQLNKISCMCQADASNDTHNTTTHNTNSECTCVNSVMLQTCYLMEASTTQHGRSYTYPHVRLAKPKFGGVKLPANVT